MSSPLTGAVKGIAKQAKKMVVLAGGVGPAAGVAVHQQMINMTDNGQDKDQGHITVLQTSFSGSVKDRTLWLQSDRTTPNPGGEMAKGINRSLSGFMDYPGNMVLGVPCNTFHSSAIWNKFISDLENPDRIEVVNMIEETAKRILRKEEILGEKVTVGLLSTTGTRDTGVYADVMKKYDIKLLTLDDEEQKNVMTAIYDAEIGIKGQKPDMKTALKLIDNAIESLRKKGAGLFILGCTELPLPYQILNGQIPDDCLDPAAILAAELVVRSGHALKPEYDTETKDDKEKTDETEKLPPSTGNDFLNLPLETENTDNMETVE